MTPDKATAKDRKGRILLEITAQGVTSPLPEMEWVPYYCLARQRTHEAFVCFVSRVARELEMEHLDYEISHTAPEPVPEGYEVW
jgi:hypothetical protein